MTNTTQNLEAIIRTATDAIITADSSGDIAAWNPAAERLFGYSEAEAIGQSITLIVPERFHEAHLEGISRVAGGGDQHIIGQTVDVFGLRNDGTEFPIALALSTWVNLGERYFTAIVRDISEHVRLLAAVRESEARTEAILDSANDAIISVDRSGAVLLWNPRAEELFGRTKDEMVGHPLTEIIPERYRDLHVAGIARVAGGGDQHVIGQTAELSALRRDGTEFPMELSLAKVGEGEDVFFTAIVRDITERVRLVEGLRDSEARVAAIVNSANDAIISVDRSGSVLMWNRRAEELFGRTEDEMVGRPLTDVIPERYRQLHVAGIARVASGGEQHVIGQTAELSALRRDGTEFPMELSLAKVGEGEDVFFTAIVRDITQRVGLIEGLRNSEARFGAILHSANDGIISIDHNGDVLLWNPRARGDVRLVRGRDARPTAAPHHPRALSRTSRHRYRPGGEWW